MKKKWMTPVLLLQFICLTSVANAMPQDVDQVMDEDTFLQKFEAALEAKDQARIESLVGQAGPYIAYDAAISQAMMGITSVAEGKDGSIYFDTAESIAAIYAKIFKKEGLRELVRSYMDFTQESCKEALK